MQEEKETARDVGRSAAVVVATHHRHLATFRRDRPYEQLDITGTTGLTEAQKVSLRALGAFEEKSVGR
jgi:hypothetical protein